MNRRASRLHCRLVGLSSGVESYDQVGLLADGVSGDTARSARLGRGQDLACAGFLRRRHGFRSWRIRTGRWLALGNLDERNVEVCVGIVVALADRPTAHR